VFVLFAIALLASLYGIVNAAWTRVRRVSVKLPNCPKSWRGRVAALVTDTHLGHVRGSRFMRRIVTSSRALRPDIVFIAGDMYDGTVARVRELAQPWARLAAPRVLVCIGGWESRRLFRDFTSTNRTSHFGSCEPCPWLSKLPHPRDGSVVHVAGDKNDVRTQARERGDDASHESRPRTWPR